MKTQLPKSLKLKGRLEKMKNKKSRESLQCPCKEEISDAPILLKDYIIWQVAKTYD